MDECQNSDTNSLGFCHLPSELIQNILFSLALPEIIRMKLVNKFLAYVISDQNFIRECNLRSRSATWLFVYKKRWRRDATIHGFSDQSNRWFKISIDDLMKQVIFYPGEDIYLLTASGNIFLFASNTQKAVIAVNLVSKAVKKIPPCPLGPRGTSSWRRSGMKLVPEPSGSGHFRFVFVELLENRPVLFEYNSETDEWQSTEAREIYGNFLGIDCMFLNALNGPYESLVVAVGSEYYNSPMILRPRLRNAGQQPSTVFSWVNISDRKHVYGDGHMMIMRSRGIDNNTDRRVKMLSSMEMWGISLNSGNWEYTSNVPSDIMKQLGKPYGVMIGCLEARGGIIRVVLMSNFEGLWDIVWLTYEKERGVWTLVPLPDCKMKGSNLAGITFSSGLSLA
ncbi:GRAS family transcription factor family protein, putative [Theobroma cacao]|uniref:GRAS family transcription factor family protein, putative n=1 Tax=Theobroma cacao TaxID=3641 RepID=A0A061GM23_THECC|nr:GRAS family transcription factor family protein, putative [Theobroma cacao]